MERCENCNDCTDGYCEEHEVRVWDNFHCVDFNAVLQPHEISQLGIFPEMQKSA